MRKLLTLGLVLLTLTLRAEPILIGLLHASDFVRATITIAQGEYTLSAGDEQILLAKGEQVDITASSGQVSVFFRGQNYAGNSRIRLSANGYGEFTIKPAGFKANGRIYREDLIALPVSGRLQLVNSIELEDYVSGVIEAESGKGHDIEYYKVQAVISRTYALNNLVRHSAEGFNLCDATHCQVYHGRARSENLAEEASEATRDIVIVDANIRLITAAFHSNCGGRTVNAEDVWTKPVPYLTSREDTFCIRMPHSTWEKTITAERWNNYLESKRSDYQGLSGIQTTQPVFVADSTFCIPLRQMREDLKLRSTNFELEKTGHEIRFFGQGFGHGVGLCQEGAMRMAMLDYCYEDIIHFYYRDVHLIPRYMMWFFEE